VKASQVEGLSARLIGGLGTAPLAGVSRDARTERAEMQKTPRRRRGRPLKTKATGRCPPAAGSAR